MAERPQQGHDEGRSPLACEGCHRTIEWCSFCDRTDCGSAVCYGCLVVDLHETLPHPHGHGG
jgi:hypothetical protein